MGQNHARVYSNLDGVRLVGVADANATTAARVASRYNISPYQDVDALLDEQKPDLVSLAVPTDRHFEVGMRVMERGVHVLMEKPIAQNIDQGQQLIECADRIGVIFGVGHVERFNPAVGELQRRLREGAAGRIHKIFCQRLSPYPSRIRDAGVVVDLASHDIDLMRCLMDEPIVRLYGETLQSINSDREDLFNGLVRFKGGAVGVLDVNWMTPTKVRRLTVTGTRGLFDCNLLSQELFYYENESAPSQWDTLSMLRGVTEGNVLGIRIQRQEPLVVELTDFVSAVRDGRKPAVAGRDALETLNLAMQFIRSGAEGKPIVDFGDQHWDGPVSTYKR
jgi:predicted dehydrogenase